MLADGAALVTDCLIVTPRQHRAEQSGAVSRHRGDRTFRDILDFIYKPERERDREEGGGGGAEGGGVFSRTEQEKKARRRWREREREREREGNWEREGE